jgi:hypothetical protein
LSIALDGLIDPMYIYTTKFKFPFERFVEGRDAEDGMLG